MLKLSYDFSSTGEDEPASPDRRYLEKLGVSEIVGPVDAGVIVALGRKGLHEDAEKLAARARTVADYEQEASNRAARGRAAGEFTVGQLLLGKGRPSRKRKR